MNYNKIISFAFISFSMISAMDKNPDLHTCEVTAKANVIHAEVPMEQLLSIKKEEELNDFGIIQALVIRPQKNYRTLVASCIVTRACIEGDKHYDEKEDQELHAVTLMRADVSNALGGAHIPGDNIHVEGLHIGEKYISPGDLLTVTEPDNKAQVKAVFLATYIPHSACWKLESRAGKNALNFLNADLLRDEPSQRLRGIRLAVLKEGIISLGDQIFIERDEDRNERIVQLGLQVYVHSLLEKSKPIAQKMKAEDAAKAEYRKKAQANKKMLN